MLSVGDWKGCCLDLDSTNNQYQHIPVQKRTIQRLRNLCALTFSTSASLIKRGCQTWTMIFDTLLKALCSMQTSLPMASKSKGNHILYATACVALDIAWALLELDEGQTQIMQTFQDLNHSFMEQYPDVAEPHNTLLKTFKATTFTKDVWQRLEHGKPRYIFVKERGAVHPKHLEPHPQLGPWKAQGIDAITQVGWIPWVPQARIPKELDCSILGKTEACKPIIFHETLLTNMAESTERCANRI